MEEPIAQELSDGVEAAIKKVIELQEDELDVADFDAIEYINSCFPTEDSLQGLDGRIASFDMEVKRLDAAIFETVRAQSTAGATATKDLEEAKVSITELFGKIKDIKSKAEQSEVMVQDICVDIRQLDVAKRHLTTTITVLKRLQMLVTAVDRLQANSSTGQYENAGQLLQAVSQLFTNFKDYASVPKVKELMDTVTRVKAQMQERIVRDFQSLTEMGASEVMSHGYESDDAREDMATTSLDTLRQACEVVDALEGDMRARLISSFCAKQLEPYVGQFKAEEVRSLGAMDRRYHWFRRTLRDLEARFSSVMPKHWHIAHHFCVQFCTTTRADVEGLLAVYTDPDSAPPDALVGALQKTLGFEAEMKRRFEAGAGAGSSSAAAAGGDDGDVDAAAQEEWLRTLSTDGQLYGIREEIVVSAPIAGIISSAFDPYMGAYIKWEREQLDTFVVGASTTEDVDGASTLPVLRSSPSLFLAIRHAVQRCIKLSTGQTLFKLIGAIKGGLMSYCRMLEGRLPPIGSSPFPGDTVALSVEDAGNICMVINTAEYCAETLPQLTESLKLKVEDSFKDDVDLEDVYEEFMTLTSTSVFRLGSGVACMLDPALESLIKVNWTAVTEVGDSSAYVQAMTAALQAAMPYVRLKLTQAYFNNFCDKFAHAFTPRYMHALYRTKRIGEMGAQQMLLDAQAIKTLLLKAPALVSEEEEEDGADPPDPASPIYVKFVTREMPRVELLLKLISTPKDRFAESIKMLWQEATAQDLQRVMELKNMNRSEQREVLEALGLNSSSGSSMRNFGGRLTAGLDSVATATKEALRRK